MTSNRSSERSFESSVYSSLNNSQVHNPGINESHYSSS